MSAAVTLPDLPSHPGGIDAPTPGRFAPLLSLVRRLIDYGKQLAAALQQSTPAIDLDGVARTFGSYDFGQIIASIVRGLHRARELEARLEHLDARPTPVPASAAVRSAPRPRAATSVTPPSDKPAAEPVRLPTPDEIARKVRRQPIGAVLADICRDLGILPCHPLWRELHDAITKYNGNYVRLVFDIFDRPWLDPDTRQPIISGVPLFCRAKAAGSTGPPS